MILNKAEPSHLLAKMFGFAMVRRWVFQHLGIEEIHIICHKFRQTRSSHFFLKLVHHTYISCYHKQKDFVYIITIVYTTLATLLNKTSDIASSDLIDNIDGPYFV